MSLFVTKRGRWAGKETSDGDGGKKREQRKMQKKCKAFAKSVLALKREKKKKKKREKGESLGIKEASLGISAMEAGGGGRLILRSFSVG